MPQMLNLASFKNLKLVVKQCYQTIGQKLSKSAKIQTRHFGWFSNNVYLVPIQNYRWSFTAYSSNSALSERLDQYSAQHTVKISSHAGLLKDLDQNHQRTAGRVEHVATQVGKLKDGVNLMEGRLRGEVKTKLEDVRSVLLTALSKAEESIKDIQEDVKKGIV